jgi:hypothetical protein
MTLSQLEAESEAFDYTAFRTADVDRYCSSTRWILPCFEAWGGPAVPRIYRGEGGYAAFLEVSEGGRRVWTGFDTAWEFACPLVGEIVEAFSRACERWPWDILLVPGIERDSALFGRLVRRLVDRFPLRRGPGVKRLQASLEGGLGAFLARRSTKFRREILRARRRAEAAGVRFESAGADAFPRILGVEQRSWKGPAGEGLMVPRMEVFYRALLERLSLRGGARLLFARRDGEDLGYIFGGVRDGVYRGFQFSFAEEARPLAIGNVMQLVQIEQLCGEGVALYDLGVELDYKHRWGERVFETVTLAALRREG